MNYLAAELSMYQDKIMLLSKQSFGELTPERLETPISRYIKYRIIGIALYEPVPDLCNIN